MKTKYELLMQNPEFRRLQSIDGLVADASDLIAGLMSDQSLSKADLARRLKKSRAWVTQLLSGRANVTVRTLAEIAFELGAEIKLQQIPLNRAETENFSSRGSKPWRVIPRTERPHVMVVKSSTGDGKETNDDSYGRMEYAA